jgi:hypothetical protein
VRRTVLSVVFLLTYAAIAALPPCAKAQETDSDWAWNSILRHEGVEFLYIFYREADSRNNGVVLKLVNWNDYPVRYRFRIVFRSGEDERDQTVSGTIDARSMLTGEAAGLFFIPFRDGRTIGEIGLKGYRVDRLPPLRTVDG